MSKDDFVKALKDMDELIKGMSDEPEEESDEKPQES